MHESEIRFRDERYMQLLLDDPIHYVDLEKPLQGTTTKRSIELGADEAHIHGKTGYMTGTRRIYLDSREAASVFQSIWPKSSPDIDFIIPAKTSSQRVPNKNWRPFRGEDSLVDLVIEKLLNAGVDAERIHISCECEQTALPVAHRWGVNFLQRSGDLCANEVPLTKWIRSITAQVPEESDIAWCQVCDPHFNEYAECLEKWDGLSRTQYDSLVVCHPWRGYLMTAEGQPIGWSFGEHHTPSQQLPEFRTMPFTLSLLTRQAIERTGYHVGASPFWYVSRGDHVDIDTPADFAASQRAD